MVYKSICLSVITALILCTGMQAQESLDLNDNDNNYTPFPSSGLLDRKHPEAVNLWSNPPEEGYDFVANPNQRLDVRIDPTLIAPSNYGNMFSSDDFDDYEINLDLEVGFTPGMHGVSPSGAATYTVPIQLPPGTNGMEPELAISYNSQGGSGLLGMGWNLAGLSSISRVGKTIYHDGKSDKIRFDSSDRFALDGNRLISTGSEQYATEMETFSLITSHGEAGSGPGWFEVRTKDGLTLEYGKTDDSRYVVTSNGEALNWMLNKVYDQHGNYMEYIYIQDNGQIRIDKIKYTGNEVANLEPYNEIQFYYQDREDKSVGYVGGSEIKSSYLLRKISVKSEGLQFRSYMINYANDALYSFLSSIQLFGKDNQSTYNETIFEYETKPSFAHDPLLNDITRTGLPVGNGTFCNLDQSSIEGIAYFPGDFNGDGVTDFLGVSYMKTWTGSPKAKYTNWAIFLNHNATGGSWTCHELTSPGSWLNNDGEWSTFLPSHSSPVEGFTFLIGDLDGDGIDDIVVGSKMDWDEDHVYYNSYFINYDSGNFTWNEGNETIWFDDTEQPVFLLPNIQKRHAVVLGDFDGDGISEFFGINMRTFDFKIRSFNSRVSVDVNYNGNSTRIRNPNISVGDLNGNGTSDINIVSSSLPYQILDIVTFNFSSPGDFQNWNWERSFIQSDINEVIDEFPLKRAAGDFNGDGISDLLINFKDAGTVVTGIFYSKGMSPTSLQNSYVGHTVNSTFVGKRSYCVDINGDGITDVVSFPFAIGESYQTNFLSINLSRSDFPSFESYNVILSESINQNFAIDFGDFNGDGNIEMMLKNNNTNGDINFLSLNSKSSTNDRRLKRVKNGFQQTTEYRYQTLAETHHAETVEEGLLHGDPESFPYRKIFGGFPVVSNVLTENPIGEKVEKRYQFYGGVAHLQGNGFLGFERIRSHEINPYNGQWGGNEPDSERRHVHNEFELHKEYSTMLPLNTKNYVGQPFDEGSLVSETSLVYSFVDTNNETYWVKHESTSSTNHLDNLQTQETFTYNDIEGNLIEKEVEVGENGNTETTTTEYSNFFTLGNWHTPSSLPQSVTTTTFRHNEVALIDNTNFEYNQSDGNILSTNKNIGTDAWSYEEYEYNNNPFGLVEKVSISGHQPTENGIDINGLITANEQINPITTDLYEYTPNGRNVLKHTDRFGFETEYTYYNRWSKPKTVTNHLGQQSYMEYDGFGRMKKEVDHLGNVTTIERQFYELFTDQFNDCQSATDVLYQKTTTLLSGDAVRTSTKWYNKFGQIRIQDATTRSGIVRTTTCYDKRGRTFETTTRSFIGADDYKTTEIVYDKFDRILSQTTNPVQMDMDYEVLLTGGTENKLTSNAMDTRRTETDATGRVVKRKDSGNANTLDYIYQSGGLLKTVKLNNSIVAENSYDAFGRQIALSDPMASGTTLYQYDAFDRLVFQKDNKENTFRIQYDDFGRTEIRDVVGITPSLSGEYSYEYYDSGHQNALLKKETAPGDNATEYTYNDNGSITSITETIDEVDYTTLWQFDQYQKPTRKEYPSGFAIRYHYDNGYLQRITTDAGATIWEIGNDGVNARGQIMGYSLGNGVSVSHTYNDDFLPESVIAENDEEELFTFTYYFKPESGNLRNRNLHGMTEWFEYDNGTSVKLHRLTGAGLSQNSVDVSYLYSPNGNIVSKSDVGQYTYDSDHGYQVSQINFEGGVDPEDPLIDMVGHQAVVYNHFNSASLIHNLISDRKVELFYGPDDQRRMAVYKEGDDVLKTRYYVGAYEKQIDDDNNEIRVHYISAMGQLVAIYVEDDSYSQEETDDGLNGKMYYPHLDHLGSIIHLSDASGEIVETFSYDAWGRPRNPDDLTYVDIPERPDWLWRGYTGHEHLDEFGLINMNGRLYDPVVGRMLSPDNYVPTPDFSQGYNRYSYVLNNPLKYTDPDGEHPILVAAAIGAAISVTTNGISNAANNQPFFKGVGQAAVIGAFSGALSFGIGEAAATLGGFGKLAFQTAAHGHLGGLASGASGGTYGQGFVSGAAGSLIASGTNSLLKNADLGTRAAGTTVGGGVAGGIGAEIMGGNFWDGARNGAISAALNHGIHSGAFGEGLMMASITGRTRHLFGPDAISLAGTVDVTSGVAMGLEKGALIVLRGEDAGIYNYNDLGAGVGGISVSVGAEAMKLYTSSTNVLKSHFYGPRYEANLSFTIASVNIGGAAIYAKHSQGYTVGYGVTIGGDAIPVNISFQINKGASSEYFHQLNSELRNAFYSW